MLRWFSLRRIGLWSLLSGGILVALVFWGRSIYEVDKQVRRSRFQVEKARAHMHQHSSDPPPPRNGNGPSDNIKAGDELVPWNIILPPPSWRSNWPTFSGSLERPFQLYNMADIQAMFIEWLSSTSTPIADNNTIQRTMEDYLWQNYGILALPLHTTRDEQGNLLPPLLRWEKSIKRHVSLWYGEYRLRGGQEARHLGLPVCSTIGIKLGTSSKEGKQVGTFTAATNTTTAATQSSPPGEYSTKELNDLAGSQGSLRFLDIDYRWKGIAPPFLIPSKLESNTNSNNNNNNGQLGVLRLVVKHFGATSEHKDGILSESQDASPSEAEKKTRRALRSFAKEHYSLGNIQHPGIIQPVCYEKAPLGPLIVYPFMLGGDLIPITTDHLAFRNPRNKSTLLSPDDAFLPRFFRQLVEALVAIHEAGILHLDLKPENFVVHGPDRNWFLPWDEPALSRYRLVVVDFGLAMSIMEAEAQECLSVGTEVTMAPEQHLCNHRAGRGTDWWAVAAAMWRTRVFWEPSITEEERDHLLDARCEHWGHPTLPDQPFFSSEFRQVMEVLLVADPQERDFTSKEERWKALLDMPYLLKGLGAAGRETRLKELAAQGQNPGTQLDHIHMLMKRPQSKSSHDAYSHTSNRTRSVSRRRRPVFTTR